MTAADESWADLTPAGARDLLAVLPISWWIAGGWALDLAAGRQTRPHGDVDVALLRPEHERLRTALASWDLRIAYRGVLTPWAGGPVGPHENAVWGRRHPGEPWLLDFKLELVEGDEWVYRRDSGVRRPLGAIGRVTEDGIPYLDPEIVSLYAAG